MLLLSPSTSPQVIKEDPQEYKELAVYFPNAYTFEAVSPLQLFRPGKCFLLLSVTGFPGGLVVKSPPTMEEAQEMWVRSLGQEDPLDRKSTRLNSSHTLASRMPSSA